MTETLRNRYKAGALWGENPPHDILPRMSKRGGCLANIFKLLLVCVIAFYAALGLTSPWAFHIGGRSTPLLYWSGYGKLVTKSGTYPLYVLFYPSAHFSKLHIDGLRPTGGLKGTASLCAAPGVVENLTLSGTIYGGWASTQDALMQFRLLDYKIFDVGQRQGYFDLYGRWRGSELVMDDRGESSGKFRSGLKIDHASVTFDYGSLSDFKKACSALTNVPASPSSGATVGWFAVRVLTILIVPGLLRGSKSFVTGGGLGVEKSDPEVYSSRTATHPL
jgi:hypothetical protein